MSTQTGSCFVSVPYDDLRSADNNVRRSLKNIPALADSIAEHGLLENLVVVEPTPNFPYYQIEAGNRRHMAIGMLRANGRWPMDKLVPCLVQGQGNPWPALVENLQRDEVPIWDMGRRFHEMNELGYTQEEIAAHIHKAQGWVSRAIKIGQGLSPKTTELIEKTNARLTVRELQRCALLWKDGEPDLEKQEAFVRRHMGLRPGKRMKKKVVGNKETVFSRFKYLRDEMRIPPGARPVVAAVVRYLSGNVGRIRWPRRLDETDLGDVDTMPLSEVGEEI